MVFSYLNAVFDPDQFFKGYGSLHRGWGRGMTKPQVQGAGAPEWRIRPAEAADLGQVIAIDAEVTGLEKTDYWYELFHRYGGGRTRQRLFLVAESGAVIQGFIIGEIRDWEFGSAPCGWVFGLSVRASARLAGGGARMLGAPCGGLPHPPPPTTPPPGGGLSAAGARPGARLAGVGARMLEAICDGFRHAGVHKVRTMLARDNSLVLSFFRSQGMMAAPFIPLEKNLD